MRISVENEKFNCWILAGLTSDSHRLACDAFCNAQITVARGQLLLFTSFRLSLRGWGLLDSWTAAAFSFHFPFYKATHFLVTITSSLILASHALCTLPRMLAHAHVLQLAHSISHIYREPQAPFLLLSLLLDATIVANWRYLQI